MLENFIYLNHRSGKVVVVPRTLQFVLRRLIHFQHHSMAKPTSPFSTHDGLLPKKK